MRHYLLIFILVSFAAVGPLAFEANASVATAWPLFDWRHSPETDYTSLHLLGPFVKYERKGTEREVALRPLFYRASDGEGASYLEVFPPLFTKKTGNGSTSSQGLHLLNYDFGKREEGSDNRFMLFPLLFYGRNGEQNGHLALFPVGGKITRIMGYDEARFALFPLYLKTEKRGTSSTNILWPVFSLTRGEKERGWRVWPLMGKHVKEGKFDKRFWLWPLFFREDLRLDTEEPVRKRIFFPLYAAETSPSRVSRTYVWPFFRFVKDDREEYSEWDAPWPLIRRTTGVDRKGIRLLPVYSDESGGGNRNRWFLWPLFKTEETTSDVYKRRRFRILYFLYTDLEETMSETGETRLKRRALWPFFSYDFHKGVSRLHLFSLLEPFFPDYEGIDRTLAPLWRIYQKKWDGDGNMVTSFMWNLYWKEERGHDFAMEIFPLFSYRKESVGGECTDFSLLKGLFRYRDDTETTSIQVFFIPWTVATKTSPLESK